MVNGITILGDSLTRLTNSYYLEKKHLQAKQWVCLKMGYYPIQVYTSWGPQTIAKLAYLLGEVYGLW